MRTVVRALAIVTIVCACAPNAPFDGRSHGPSGEPSPGAPTPAASTPTTLPPETAIEGFGLSNSNAWVIQGDRLFATFDEGRSWTSVPTPPDVALRGADVEVPDREHVWLAGLVPATSPSAQIPTVWVSSDGGGHWDRHLVGTPSEDIARARLEVADQGHAYVLLAPQRGEGSGQLRKSTDGGITWDVVSRLVSGPSLGSTDFSVGSGGRAWMGGSMPGEIPPPGNRLFSSVDGGTSWLPAFLPVPSGFTASEALPVTLPTPVSRDELVLPVAYGDADRGLVAFYQSSDGGASWVIAALLREFVGDVHSIAIVDGQQWIAPSATPGRLLKTTDRGQSWQMLDAGLQGAAIDLRMGRSGLGWAVVLQQACTAAAGCDMAQFLMSTSDGGASWVPWAPPEQP
jgi:photosystem II stability/assembly factor-like uncharacterized protein